MFFYLSKILGFFLLPTNILCTLIVIALVLQRSKYTNIAQKTLKISVIALLVTAFTPLGNGLLLPLEQRFPHLPSDALKTAPYGIIVLGGSVDTVITTARGQGAVNEAGDRLIETARLAKKFPKARILFTGGAAKMVYEGMSEAEAVQPLFSAMGINPSRIRYERSSKNTWQNAIYTKTLLAKDARRRWLLVTSAYHMPRSMGCFRKAGINVIAWPVDYRTRGTDDLYRFFYAASKGWKWTDIAVREWIGLVVYRLTGRTDNLFPG